MAREAIVLEKALDNNESGLHEESDDVRAAWRAAAAYEAWKQDPRLARPWEEIEAELVAEGLLDHDD